MWSRVRLQATDTDDAGEVVVLGHGALIGRLWSAALLLDDPRISEAHALVSQRGPDLKLLALRRRFLVDGKPVTEVALRAGQSLRFADGIDYEVLDVEGPPTVLGMEAAGMPARALPGTVALITQPTPAFAPAAHPGAVAHVWCAAAGWRLRPRGGRARPLEEGDEIALDGVTWRAVPDLHTRWTAPGHDDRVSALRVLDDATALTGSWDGTLRRWSLNP